MRVTEPHVSDGRLGRCKEHGAGAVQEWTAEEIAIEERTRPSLAELRAWSEKRRHATKETSR